MLEIVRRNREMVHGGERSRPLVLESKQSVETREAVGTSNVRCATLVAGIGIGSLRDTRLPEWGAA